MTINFKFNKIFIIESLGGSTLQQTGEGLYNDYIRWKTQPTDKLDSQFFKVQHKKEFIESFDEIQKQQSEYGILPFIHFEIHGSEKRDGLILKSGELISWQELADLTRKINVISKNNLVISLATCYGAFFKIQIKLTKPAPFCGCVATINKTNTAEIEISFKPFFEVIFSSTDFTLAVKKLNETNQVIDMYHFTTCEEVFEQVFEKLSNEDLNPGTIENRKWANRLVKKVQSTSIQHAGIPKKRLKNIVRQNLKELNKKQIKREYLNVFLMKNL